ncbi:MAG: glycosyltransferase [bacterium]
MDLTKRKIIVSTHVYTTGPSQDLRKFLIDKKIERLLFIGHPLFYNKILKGSGYEIYKKGEKEKERYAKLRKIPFVISCFKDVFLNVLWGIKCGRGSDLYIGFDNLNAFSGVILKFFGIVQKTVYYVVDYNPKRYKNRLLNSIYHKIDQFCVTYCDETWNLSPRMEEGRKKYFNFSKGNQKVVPMGAWLDRIQIPNFDDIEKHTLVFSGHVLEKQGIQHVIEAIPEIIKEINDFKFKILGDGEYLGFIKDRISGLGIEKYVEYTGFIDDPTDMEKMLTKCALGVAIYEERDKNGNLAFTYFADPGKLKLYLACGVPILLTDVSYNAKLIEDKKCGMIIKGEPQDIAHSVISLMKNGGKLKEYRDNAISYSKEFDWNKIFSNNLSLICSIR